MGIYINISNIKKWEVKNSIFLPPHCKWSIFELFEFKGRFGFDKKNHPMIIFWNHSEWFKIHLWIKVSKPITCPVMWYIYDILYLHKMEILLWENVHFGGKKRGNPAICRVRSFSRIFHELRSTKILPLHRHPWAGLATWYLKNEDKNAQHDHEAFDQIKWIKNDQKLFLTNSKL